jgi:hypothetical protein
LIFSPTDHSVGFDFVQSFKIFRRVSLLRISIIPVSDSNFHFSTLCHFVPLQQRYRLLALPGYGEKDYLPSHEPRSRAAQRWAERNDIHIKMQSNNQKHYRNSNPM